LHTRLQGSEPSRRSSFIRTVYRTGLGLVLAFIVLWGSLWLWIDDPLDLQPPKDSDLIAVFSRHRTVFERIVTMAQEDGEPGWRPDLTGNQRLLPTERARSYKKLMSELGSGVEVTWDHNSGGVSFIFAGGGSLLAIGDEWFKGIAYIPDLKEDAGTLVQSLNGAKRLKAGEYLRKIDKNWFLYYERTG
jgi:hypothetical protein